MLIHDISRDISKVLPYPGDPQTQITRLADLSRGDRYNLSSLSFSAHIGTHIDAPLHYVRGGSDVASMSLDCFFGECTVVSIEGILTGEHMDTLLPYCKKRIILHGNKRAFISSSAIDAIENSGVLLVGTDADSIGADFEEDEVHYRLLNSGIAVLENVELSGIKDGTYVLSAFPLKISECEASPCRAILIEGQQLLWF